MVDIDLLIVKQCQAANLVQVLDATHYSETAMNIAKTTMGLLKKQAGCKESEDLIQEMLDQRTQWAMQENEKAIDIYKELQRVEKEIALLRKG